MVPERFGYGTLPGEVLGGVDAVAVHSRATSRTATRPLTVRGREAAGISRFLAGGNVQDSAQE
ncbi:hypothetical protein [Arthrobacter mobilis]|uniref:Uncharacterized protein n=1 Tax=Arthrobacter mobilis TaxID=2724944 RepID=A0A7X6HFT2_9MICC|nr:hypothetical protein [Arthrobacter mobilis]NKX56236.1 hypothetical protein [Arthrobacter mobilis]